MKKNILIRVAISISLILGIAYFFEISYFWALVATVGLGMLGGIVNLPENMPGKADNPDGKGPHPYNILALFTVMLFLLFAVGNYFPVVTTFGVN